jgi:hypothetical protein
MYLDVNAAIHFQKRGGGKVPQRVRELSIIPKASRIIPVKEKKKKNYPLKKQGNWVARLRTCNVRARVP